MIYYIYDNTGKYTTYEEVINKPTKSSTAKGISLDRILSQGKDAYFDGEQWTDQPDIEKQYENGVLDDQTFKALRIDQLQKQLTESDYKASKNMECQAEGLPLPYPKLHSERQPLRDEIRKLQGR